MTERLNITQVGRKVATSGLCPEAAAFFLSIIPQKWAEYERLLPCLPTGDEGEEERAALALSDLAYALFHLCLVSPEFERVTPPPPRIAVWQLADRRESERATRLQDALTIRPWDRNIFAANGAELAVDWINGTPLRELEGRFPDLRGGSLTGLFRDLGQILAGIAEVLVAATSQGLPEEERSGPFQTPDLRTSTRRIVNIMRRFCVRLERGLPDEVVWMVELRRSVNSGGGRLVSNTVAMTLFGAGFASPDAVLDSGRTNQLQIALRAHSSEFVNLCL